MKAIDVFKPKSEKEIDKNLENDPDYVINDEKDATEHLRMAIKKENIPYVHYALRHGGRIIDEFYNLENGTQNSAGNIWVAFNENVSEEIIIELLKTKEFLNYYSTREYFRLTILDKVLYMGMIKVARWLLQHTKNNVNEIYEVLQESHQYTTTFHGYKDVYFIFEEWCEQHKK